MYVYVIKNIC